jgi:hypothetical protein
MKRLAILCGLILLIPFLLLTAGTGCGNPGEHRLVAVWGSSSSDVFAVGHMTDWGSKPYATILHYDGTKWRKGTHSNYKGGFVDVWGSSASDIFAFGSEYGILHYDGTKWSEMSDYSESALDTISSIYAVWGSSSSDIFAVGWESMWGEDDSVHEAPILHYDGTNWSEMIRCTDKYLVDIWGSSSSDIFAVGWEYTTSIHGVPLILHYDGTSWNEMSSIGCAQLNAVWGSSSSDVFAVGHKVVAEGDKFVCERAILHYDGTSWSEMNTPPPQTEYGWDLCGVWGSSSSAVFAVGSCGTILHYDGTKWSEMSIGTGGLFEDVWGSSSSDVFAVGGYNEYIILHYDGTSWSEMSLD